MRLLRVLRQRARSILRSAQADAELARELKFHLEQLTRENVESGMEPAAARLAARRALGGAAQIEEQCRDQRRIGWITDLSKDVVYAWRMLRKSPGFTVAAVSALALGVGASIAVYALAEAMLMRSLPYPAPERLVALNDVHERRGDSGVGQDNFRDWQAANTVFERMAYTEFSQVTLTGHGDAERITGREVSPGFFEMMGVAPQLGRWFTTDEQKPGAAQVVILSHGFWMRKLGASPEVVGGTLIVNDRAYRVTGVMPASFRFNEGSVTEYWTPIAYQSYGRQQHQYSAYARLKPGVTLVAAQAQMSEIARRLEQAYPDNAGWGVRVRSLRREVLGPFQPALAIFAAAALMVLLVACGNVASLLLARGIGRSKEIAVRMALGAGKRRVVRLLLAEAMLLSVLSAAAGIGLAFWLLRLAVAASPPRLELGAMVSVSPTLAAFAVGLTLLTGLLTGLWPALRGSRSDLQNELKESGIALVAGRRHARSLNALVVGEIALAVVLLSFAGLLTKSFVGLLQRDLGYRTDHLVTFRMPLPSSRYKTAEARVQFWDRLLADLVSLPGVISAAASAGVPMGGTYGGMPMEVEGDTTHHEWADVMARGDCITPDYFRTLGIGLRAGRTFNAGDGPDEERVAIVNESFVHKLLPGRAPVGTRVRLPHSGAGNEGWQRIVGVIGDSRYTGPTGDPEPEIYRPYKQEPYMQFVALHTMGAEQAAVANVRKILRRLDPELPITQVRTIRQSLDNYTQLERQMMALVSALAAVTLAMATLGLGGVMAYLVSQRRREIGLRMALGARSADVSREVIRGALRLILAGSLAGVLIALAGARVLESLLYGVRPRDPAVILAAPALLAAIALLACAVPARRAASIEPMAALRQE